MAGGAERSGAGIRLGIDFGTSSTVAVIAVDDRPPRPLLFDGSPLLPSAVCAGPGGRILVGRDAIQLATADPAGFEPHPKRCVDEGTVLLAGRDVTVDAMFAAVFARVLEHAGRFGDRPVAEVTVTHPAGWGAARKAVLARAAPAGARLVPEPVAAAHFFVDVAGQHLPDGATALVYDLGAGTFDASIVRRVAAAGPAGRAPGGAAGGAPDGAAGSFEVVASTGLTDAGGLDIDAAIVDYLRATLTGADTWRRLTDGDDPAAHRGRRQLWANVREAKEVLSRLSTTLVHVPLFETDVPLGREQLEELAAPVLDRTVRAARELIASVDERPAAVFLAGGASHMPAVATALHRALGIAPSIVDEPELAVAEGALRVPATGAAPGAANAESAWPAPAPIAAAPAAGVAPARRRALVGALSVAMLAALGAAVWAALPDEQPGRASPAAPSASASASPSALPTYPPGVDPCLLGTWRREVATVTGYIDAAPLNYVGGKGAVMTFRADGTSESNFDKSTRQVASYRGDRWSWEVRGTIKGRYLADGTTLRWNGLTAKGTGRLYRNNRLNNKRALYADGEPDTYTCIDDRLSLSGTVSEATSEWVRITPPAPTRPAAPTGPTASPS